MSVYIKGLQMPKTDKNGIHHGIQAIMDSEGDVLVSKTWYKAIPVPDHGDLLDKDELSRLFGESFEYFLARLDLKCPKAVIPAERSEE